MENVDISAKVKNIIKFGLISLLALSAVIGYGVFQHYHATEKLQIADAKVTGTMVSVRALANGKIKELTFQDGDEVQAGDVIAKVEVSVTPEQIQQLEEAVALAKDNYENLKLGQTVKVAIKRVKTVEPPAIPAENSNANVSATLESLAERAKRMEELFEMGAVSAVQRDAAKQKYEDAKVEGVPSENPSTPATPATIEEIEYVDQWQPTPPAVLATAESAIKQAELALNVAKQEAQQTEITAPVSGIIYYSVEMENDLSAGDVVAKVGGSTELWLEAEVEENIFDKIPLGKKVSYELEGKNLFGTVTEKISPTKTEEVTEEIEVEENIPAENPVAENTVENLPVENSATENLPPTEENKNQPTFSDSSEPINDKYILKFSIPAKNDIEFKPNTTTVVKISL